MKELTNTTQVSEVKVEKTVKRKTERELAEENGLNYYTAQQGKRRASIKEGRKLTMQEYIEGLESGKYNTHKFIYRNTAYKTVKEAVETLLPHLNYKAFLVSKSTLNKSTVELLDYYMEQKEQGVFIDGEFYRYVFEGKPYKRLQDAFDDYGFNRDRIYNKHRNYPDMPFIEFFNKVISGEIEAPTDYTANCVTKNTMKDLVEHFGYNYSAFFNLRTKLGKKDTLAFFKEILEGKVDGSFIKEVQNV